MSRKVERLEDVSFRNLETGPVVQAAEVAANASRSRDNRRNSLGHLVPSLGVLLEELGLSGAPVRENNIH